ncbi:hypothetical protein TDB9533_01008 [Thalassocella blandensis]|nr:hypothetical protein TDB9533_01008 [Thalassocella blandensis]
MLFGVFSILSILLALIAIYFAIRLLANLQWFGSWVRGTVGILLVAFSVALVLVSLDIQSYKRLLNDTPILTMSFELVGEQHYKVKLSYVDDKEDEEYDLYGDQWVVDARILQLRGVFETFGAKPGYRLDRLAGRYYSLQDEHRKKRSVYELQPSQYGFDFWAWLRDYGVIVPFVQAEYGSATYLPMEHGAIFQVSLSARGLVARPLNSIAEQAINRWK